MAVGDLFHPRLFPLQMSFPEMVCPIVRPEFVQLVKTPFMRAVFKSDRKVMGPLPETFLLSVPSVS